MKRPMVKVALVYAGGLLLAEWVAPPLGLLFVFGLSLTAAAITWPAGRRWLMWPLILLTGWINLLQHTAILSPVDLRLLQGEAPALATVRGVLLETPDE
ncbi:MAG TPA: hypothetical protein VHP11_07590, partial [Tepidisphaeraceae bacterium]|nr:hypothetical protein [Tepidisphaeraceae bacterium]